jgi:hypothetical protein
LTSENATINLDSGVLLVSISHHSKRRTDAMLSSPDEFSVNNHT